MYILVSLFLKIRSILLNTILTPNRRPVKLKKQNLYLYLKFHASKKVLKGSLVTSPNYPFYLPEIIYFNQLFSFK